MQKKTISITPFPFRAQKAEIIPPNTNAIFSPCSYLKWLVCGKTVAKKQFREYVVENQ